MITPIEKVPTPQEPTPQVGEREVRPALPMAGWIYAEEMHAEERELIGVYVRSDGAVRPRAGPDCRHGLAR